MNIKQFLFTVFLVIISLAIYLNFKYLAGVKVEENSVPIKDFTILEIWCHDSPKMSNTITIKYKGEKYYVSLTSGVCSEIESGKIQPKLFYIEDKNTIFYSGQYLPLTYVYLTYIAAFLLPLFGFIVYRKELNKHFTTI